MRTQRMLGNEIKKLRIITNSKRFSHEARDGAWNMMLALQWAVTSPDEMKLTPMDLCGISVDDAYAVRTVARRKRRP